MKRRSFIAATLAALAAPWKAIQPKAARWKSFRPKYDHVRGAIIFDSTLSPEDVEHLQCWLEFDGTDDSMELDFIVDKVVRQNPPQP